MRLECVCSAFYLKDNIKKLGLHAVEEGSLVQGGEEREGGDVDDKRAKEALLGCRWGA